MVCSLLLFFGVDIGIGIARGGEPSDMKITSPAFDHQAQIPSKYTCEGADVSPELAWSGVPDDAATLALIVEDPDAPDPDDPQTTWTHWVLYNIPTSADGLVKDVRKLPGATMRGLNDWSREGYGGPCPPVGEHRYFFKLYALDTTLEFDEPPGRKDLLTAIEDHVVAQAELMGTYEKKGD